MGPSPILPSPGIDFSSAASETSTLTPLPENLQIEQAPPASEDMKLLIELQEEEARLAELELLYTLNEEEAQLAELLAQLHLSSSKKDMPPKMFSVCNLSVPNLF